MTTQPTSGKDGDAPMSPEARARLARQGELTAPEGGPNPPSGAIVEHVSTWLAAAVHGEKQFAWTGEETRENLIKLIAADFNRAIDSACAEKDKRIAELNIIAARETHNATENLKRHRLHAEEIRLIVIERDEARQQLAELKDGKLFLGRVLELEQQLAAVTKERDARASDTHEANAEVKRLGTRRDILDQQLTTARAEIVELRHGLDVLIHHHAGFPYNAEQIEAALNTIHKTDAAYANLVTVDRTELEELRKDKERLDWLQAQSEDGFGWAVRRFPATGGGGMYQLIKFAKGDTTLCAEVRAAIDSAMFKEPTS